MRLLCFLLALAPLGRVTAEDTKPETTAKGDTADGIIIEDVEPRHFHREFGPGSGFGGLGRFGPPHRHRRHRWGPRGPPPGFDGPGFSPEFGGPRRRGPGPPDFERGPFGPGRPFRRGPGHRRHHHRHPPGPGRPPFEQPDGPPDYSTGAGEAQNQGDYANDGNQPDSTQGQQPSTAKPVLRFQTSCGVSTTSRIVGGEQVQKDDWSWTVALMRPARGGMEHFCGATLISDQHLITAAHCVANMRGTGITARAGYVNLNEGDPAQDLKLEKATLHPSYNSTNYYADIAIVKLKQPVEFSARLQPCCLPEARDNAGQNAIAVGWGSTSFGGPQTNVLQQVTLPIWNNQECQNKINIAVHDVMLCAGLKESGGHDACQGDSGGPLLVRNSEERWSLEGVISFGFKCAQKGVPGVYTRVSKFTDWIVDNAV